MKNTLRAVDAEDSRKFNGYLLFKFSKNIANENGIKFLAAAKLFLLNLCSSQVE
jgi:hypothetical protein